MARQGMKRKTRSFFQDRHGVQREYDPEDASGSQHAYPAEWIDQLPKGSPAQAQHQRLLELHRRVFEFIESHPRLEEYFDSGPVDGSGFRIYYAEDAPAYAQGDYPTDLEDWADMLQTIIGLIDLEYLVEDDITGQEEYYFDRPAREMLQGQLEALEEDVSEMVDSLEPEPAGAACI